MATILDAIKAKDAALLQKLVTETIHDKIRKQLVIEKRDEAASLLVPRLAEGFRRGEKVVLQRHSAYGGYKSTKPTGQRSVVPIGSVGDYVRQIDASWSVVWFPGFYDGTEVQTKDLASAGTSKLWE
jgi:hypothetical protein